MADENRPVVATEAGAGLLRLARQIELLAEDAVRALGGDEAEGAGPVPLALAVNADSLATWVLPALAGVPQCVFTHITLVKHDRAAIVAFETAMLGRQEVLECFATTGDADYLLRIMVADTAAFDRFLQEAIFSQPVVHQVRSNFALRQVKFETALPVG